MTNEKAIYFLDKRKKELLEKQDSKQGFEFIKALAEIRSLEMAIKALDQTRWIPVSERLPDDSTVVFYTDNKGKIGMICYWEDLPREFENIIAWMPLPTSYQGE